MGSFSGKRSPVAGSACPPAVSAARAAAAVLGVAEVVFLGFPDGEVAPDLALRHAIARQIRRWRPDLVVTHDPAIGRRARRHVRMVDGAINDDDGYHAPG